MKTTDILDAIRGAGLTVALLPGDLLKVTPADKITAEIRNIIKQNKEILVRQVLLEHKCFPEIHNRTWTAGNPFTCKCGDVTGWTMDDETLCPVCYADKFSPPPENKAPEAEVSVPKKADRLRHGKPSPVAVKWLQEHRQALDDAGWTRSELYDRRKYRQGIAWLGLWEQAFSMAFLHDDGSIEFECSINGRDYCQTARPKRQEGK